MRLLLSGLAVSAGFYLALLLLVYLFQRQFLYYPDQARPGTSQITESHFELVPVGSAADSDLKSLWRPPARADAPVILFFHGNAGSIFNRIPIFQALADKGAGMLAVGYPGYGGNAGQPTEAALYAAAHSNYEWLVGQDIPQRRIVIVGESLGSGVATYLATESKAAGLILIAAYTGIDDMAQRQFPIFPARWLVRDRYRSIDRIAAIDMPLVWIHGTADELIPFAMGQSLFDRAAEPKMAIPVEGAGHNDLWANGTATVVRTAALKLVLENNRP